MRVSRLVVREICNFMLQYNEVFICKNRQTPSQNCAFYAILRLYYLLLMSKYFFRKNQQSPVHVCLHAKTYAILQKPINATFAGWSIQISLLVFANELFIHLSFQLCFKDRGMGCT